MRFLLAFALVLASVASSEAGCRGGGCGGRRHREGGLLSRIFHRDRGNHDEGGDDSESSGCASGKCATPNYGVGQAPEKMPVIEELKKPKSSE